MGGERRSWMRNWKQSGVDGGGGCGLRVIEIRIGMYCIVMLPSLSLSFFEVMSGCIV